MTESPSKKQIFFQRLTSTLVLWTVVLLALFAPFPTVANSAFLVFVCVLGIVGFLEYHGMLRHANLTSFKRPALTVGTLFLLVEIVTAWVGTERLSEFLSPRQTTGTNNSIHTTVFINNGGPLLLFPSLLFFWLAILKLRAPHTVNLSSLALTFFGWFYVFWLLAFIPRIYYFPNVAGNWFLFYFIVVTKFSDLGAYVVGSAIGKHKMAPRISPGKTWEGFGGALGVSTLVSIATVYLAGDALAPLRGLHCVVIGVLLGGLAVAGDLIESLIKRETQVKDSGSLFPGIGGCLDLLDSLLFNAPIFYLYCRLTTIT